MDNDKALRFNHRMSLKKVFSKYGSFYLFLLPAIIWYAIFAYYPMTGIIIAFKKYRYGLGVFGSHWVGLRYFKEFLADPHFYEIIRNTVVISLAKLIVNFPAPIILALMFNAVSAKIFKRTMQTVSYLPHFVSWVVVAAIIQKFFSPTTGLINDIRVSMDLKPIYYLGQKNLFLPFIVLSDMWKGVGYGSIIYLAALTGIDPTLYEAAEIDGANGWNKLWHITIPGISGTVGIMFLLSVGGLFGANMEQILLLQTPATFDVSEVIDTYVLKRGLNMNQFDYATAVGLFRSVISLALVVTANYLSKKFSEVSLW
ncbi:MAG: ABC transporter permease subunit [Clostridiales bacterium]|nr:ABC transporter permease subunit [Clostridiales bacterium]